MRRLISKIRKKETDVMQWHAQGGNLKTIKKVKIVHNFILLF